MRRSARVHWGETGIVAALHHDKQGARESSTFEYDAIWLAHPDRFAIDPALPLVNGPQFHRKAGDGSAFHRAIADCEPDGWARKVILRDHVKRREAARRKGGDVESRPLDSFDYLMAADDASRIGALRFQDENGTFQRVAEPGRRTAPPMVELRQLHDASRAVETSSETLADLAYLRGRGTSLGGLRPKCTVIDDDGRLAIGKFPSVQDDRAVTKGEVLALQLAAKAGINTPDARIVDADGVPVAVITRFDRRSGARIGYVSSATMIGADLHDGSEHAYTEIVDAIRIHGAQAQRDIEELWRRIAFSILITNVDDHLMNHGFLYAGEGKWDLSPVFDVNPFPERARELKTWISEERGPAASVEALLAVAPYFQIKQPKAKQILGEVERVVARWRQHGRTLGLTDKELDKFADAFEHEERAVAKRAIK